jgi:cytoskeletal protein RodZ
VDHQFGKLLQKKRTAKGISIEEAARDIRMRPAQIQALEESNLSKFPNGAYAKSFLNMYARYLGVDIRSAAELIDTGLHMRVGDFQYLTSRSEDETAPKDPSASSRYDFVVPERSSRSWIPLAVCVVIAGIAGLGFMVWNNLRRIGQLSDAPASLPQEAKTVVKVSTKMELRPEAAKPETPPPRPAVISIPPAATPAVASSAPVENAEPAIPKARPISPVARMAANDADALADVQSIPAAKPVAATALPEPAQQEQQQEEEINDAPEPNSIILDPVKKTWVVIRSAPGTAPLYEDYLYPTARPMRLPAGRYFIELQESDSVEISQNGKRIAYVNPGIVIGGPSAP